MQGNKRRPAAKWPARKKLLVCLTAAALCGGLLLLGLLQYQSRQFDKIPGLTFQEALAYTTKDDPEAVITVGILQDGAASYTVYGENGAVLPQTPHIYEIGSLTKTITAAMVSKAVREDRLRLEASIDQYLSLPEGDYPTIRELLTHTAGYKGYYFEWPMASNLLRGRNFFYGVTREMITGKAGKRTVREEPAFQYSNYGYALLGLVLEQVYGGSYRDLVHGFLQADLGLSHTRISGQDGDLGRYWAWNEDDAYQAAGALTSDINDMLAYARLLLEQYDCLADCQRSLAVINASNAQYEALGIRMDEIGMAWIIDSENHIVWHNGGTDDYNCYLGFDPAAGMAVVVLSNLPPKQRIPATVLGVKAMQEMRNAD